MKKSFKYLSLIVLLITGLASCSNYDAYSTDENSLRVWIAEYAKINSEKKYFGTNADYTAYILDSIQVGDTLTVFLAAYSGSGYLKKIYTTVSDANYLRLLEPSDSVKKMYSSLSNFKTGELYLAANNVSNITYEMRVIPIKPSKKVTLTLGAVDDTENASSIFETKIEFPIKAIKTE